MRYDIFETVWGWFGIVENNSRLAATFLPAAARVVEAAIRSRWTTADHEPGLMPKLQKQVVAHFDGRPTNFAGELDMSELTSFRQRVIAACRCVPFGELASYQDLARAAGNPTATRAVGSTMANNRWPLIVPCHRIVRSDGTIGGFSSPSGVSEKQRLLRHEGVEFPQSTKERLGGRLSRRSLVASK